MKLKRKRPVRRQSSRQNQIIHRPNSSELRQHRGISTHKAVQVLAKNGLYLDEAEAEHVLEAMYFLARLIIEQNFKK